MELLRTTQQIADRWRFRWSRKADECMRLRRALWKCLELSLRDDEKARDDLFAIATEALVASPVTEDSNEGHMTIPWPDGSGRET